MSDDLRAAVDLSRIARPSLEEQAFWLGAGEERPEAVSLTPVDRSPYPGREYDADYYLHGKETGKSLYSDYRWLPDLTVPMCRRIVEYLGIRQGETVVDFGCARGYVVKALRILGLDALGQDISEWAIAHADEETKPYLVPTGIPLTCDWLIAKDVLEHLDDATLCGVLRSASLGARKGIFAVVPLGDGRGRYVVPEYEADITHRQRLTLAEWLERFVEGFDDRCAWCFTACYRVPGIKDNWSHYREGNGFLTARLTF